MDSHAPSMLKPTLIGGVAAGVLSSIPIVNCLNGLCCSLVIGGGFLAGYLYAKDSRAAGSFFGPGNGAMVGLVAGLFYSITAWVIQGVYMKMGFGPDLDEILDQLDQAGAPAEATEIVVSIFDKFAGGFSILGFLLTLLIAAIFSTAGGLIAGTTFKVEAASPTDGAASPPDAGEGPGTPPMP